jgi:predicted CopG family antitoxin
LGAETTPKKGYKTITVRADVYDYFFNEWLKVKDEYVIKRGIRSFSAYVTYRLAQLINKEKKD